MVRLLPGDLETIMGLNPLEIDSEIRLCTSTFPKPHQVGTLCTGFCSLHVLYN